ncbi:MAG: Crp/Fnr family transcriptional regulator [Stellaceae bacterium]
MNGPTQDEKRRILEEHYLLGKLSSSEIDHLLNYARVETYPAGQEIYAKGSPGQSMFAVLRGAAKMSSVSSEGKEIVLNIIYEGDIFGEIALLDGKERSADAVAMIDCQVLVFNRRDVLPVLERHADICLMLIRILCERLRRTSAQVEDVLFRHLEARIAKALLELAQHTSGPGGRGAPLDLHLSQRDLGNLVGSTRESVNKQLQIWQRAGLIDVAKGTIMIRNAAAIQQLV